MHPSRIIREHRLFAVVSTITAGLGMTAFALFLSDELPVGQWGLFVVVLSGTAVGVVLGCHTQQANRSSYSVSSMYKMAFGVAWRVGTIWVVLAGCIEYGVTLNTATLPTTTVTVTNYPAMFLFFTGIIASGFFFTYIALATWNRIRVKTLSVSNFHIWNVVATLTGIAALIVSVVTLYVTITEDPKQSDTTRRILERELLRQNFESIFREQYLSNEFDDDWRLRRREEEDNSQ